MIVTALPTAPLVGEKEVIVGAGTGIVTALYQTEIALFADVYVAGVES